MVVVVHARVDVRFRALLKGKAAFFQRAYDLASAARGHEDVIREIGRNEED